MADVFISYAREDTDQAGRLAAEIEAVGLTVWWDRNLLPKDEWDNAIERELTAATSVMVVWTPASVENPNVKEEAHEARNQDKLTPVKVGDCKPPFFFRRHQFEDLTHWLGAPEEQPFQRLAIQLVAAAKGQEIADRLPLDGATPPRIDPDAKPAPTISRMDQVLGAIAAIGVLGGLIVAYRGWELADVIGSYAAWSCALALAALGLFRAAEAALAPGPKAMVARWLAGERSLSSSQAFLTMFEAVFGKRHFTLGCFGRSLVATVFVYGVMILLFMDFERLGARAADLADAATFRVPDVAWKLKQVLEENAILLLVIMPITNIFADYLSLSQTRKVLEWSTGRLPLALGVVFDAILTAAVFVVTLPIGPMIAIAAAGDFEPAAIYQAIGFAPEVWRGFWLIFEGHPWGEIDAALAAEANLSTTTLLIAFATTFITSVWLWFALLAAPIFWLVNLGRRKGASGGAPWLARRLGAHRQPILTLGYGAAAAVLAVAFGWREATEAMAPERAIEPFKECRHCPWMVTIPAGAFPAGTQFAAAGVRIEKPFAIGVYEVTFREWDACVTDGFCRPVEDDAGWGRGTRPVINVSWNDIMGQAESGEPGFIAWLNHQVGADVYRLPSEAEWEYATRAGSSTKYWMGDEITAREANFYDGDPGFLGSDRGQTLPVGAFEPQPFGLHDVYGNVWEWVADCYSVDLASGSKDGSPRVDECDRDTVVLRGGSWVSSSYGLRSAFRNGLHRSRGDVDYGFRVSRTAVE